MTAQSQPSSAQSSRALEWGSQLSIFVGGLLCFEAITGLWIWLLPFSVSSQVSVLVHTAAGILFPGAVSWSIRGATGGSTAGARSPTI